MSDVPRATTVALPEQRPLDPPPHPIRLPVDPSLELFVDAVREYAIFVLDPAGTVTTWNVGAQRIKGYAAAEIIGSDFSAFFIPDDVAAGKPQRLLAEATEAGECRDEGWRIRKDGSWFWANVVITAVRGGDGRLEGFVKITRDDTNRKSADEQIRQLELATDRERIGRDLHESVVHRIFEAGLEIQGTLQLISNPLAAARITAAVELLDDTLKEIRLAVADLNAATDAT